MKEIQTKTHPAEQDIYWETGLLSRVMSDNQKEYPVVSNITGKHFYDPFYGQVWDEIAEETALGREIGYSQLAKKYPENKAVFVHLMTSKVVYLGNILGIAANVLEAYRKRKLAQLIEAKMPYAEFIDEVENLKLEQEEGELKFIDSFEKAKEILYAIESQKVIKYPTGLKPIDDATEGGLYESRIYTFIARQKTGKTSMLLTISEAMNQRQVPHLFIAAEMGSFEIERRNLARYAKIPTGEMFKASNFSHMLSGVKEINKSRIYLDAPGIKFDKFKRALEIAVRKYGIKGFFLDYFQLIGGQQRGQGKVEHFEEVAQWMADFVHDKKIFAVVAAQRNKDGDTRWGESLINATDQLYMLEKNANNEAWLTMAATRYTPIINAGSKDLPAFKLDSNGVYFKDIGTD